MEHTHLKIMNKDFCEKYLNESYIFFLVHLLLFPKVIHVYIFHGILNFFRTTGLNE